MKHKWFSFFAILCALCLLAAGCGQPQSSGDSSAPGGAASADAEHGEPGTGMVVPGEDSANALGEALRISDTGKARLTYNGNVSSVAYITSASQISGYSDLRQYDDAYFEEHALVLVTETLNSGSIDVGILSINVSNSIASVTLYHEYPEQDESSTDDVATWLLWAEVDSGLEYRWMVTNPGLETDASVS